MSKYTTELRYICENYAGLTESEGYANVNGIIAKALPSIFDFDFPVYDEAYRVPLETKIVRHFYTREIGSETVGLWKLRLETKLNEVMPYFNMLYKAVTIDFNPLYDTDLKTTSTTTGKEDGTRNATTNDTKSGDESSNDRTEHDESGSVNDNGSTDASGKTEVNNTNTVNATKSEKDLYSDTPQGALTNVENETYLTNARKIEGTDNQTTTDVGTSNNTTNTTVTNTQTSNSESTDVLTHSRDWNERGNSVLDEEHNVNTTEDFVQHVIGKSGGITFGKALAEFMEGLVNIDQMLLDALECLFMGVW